MSFDHDFRSFQSPLSISFLHPWTMLPSDRTFQLQWFGNSICSGFPDSSACRESSCNVGDLGSIPGLGRVPREEKGYPLQYSGLENSIDCIVHGVAKSWTWLSDFHFPFLSWPCRRDAGEPTPILEELPGSTSCFQPAFDLGCQGWSAFFGASRIQDAIVLPHHLMWCWMGSCSFEVVWKMYFLQPSWKVHLNIPKHLEIIVPMNNNVNSVPVIK